MNDNSSTLVLLDPSSADGEAGLLVGNSEARVTVMLFIEDPSGAPLLAFADAENVSISQAAGRYLDQVIARCGPERLIEAVSSSGVDPVDEILEIAGETRASSIVVPPSRPGLGGRSWDRLVAASTVPIVLAPRIAA